MGEGLREIAEEAPRPGIILLRQQADIIAKPEEAKEQLPGILQPAHQGIIVGEPEAAGEEGALPLGQPVQAAVGLIAQDQPIDQEPALDRRHRLDETRIFGGQEADDGQQQQAGIEAPRAIGLDEMPAPRVQGVTTDLAVDTVAQPSPMPARRRIDIEANRRRGRKATQGRTLEWVKCCGLPRTSQMPLSGRCQIRARCSSQEGEDIDAARPGAEPALARQRHGIGDLAIDIELKLAGRRIADAHRSRCRQSPAARAPAIRRGGARRRGHT